MAHMRRLKPRQIHPFMSPKPYHHINNYYHSGRVAYPRSVDDELGNNPDGAEGTSRSVKPNVVEAETQVQGPINPETLPQSSVEAKTATEVTSTTEDAVVVNEPKEQTNDDDDFLKHPGFLSLLDISLPSVQSSREENRTEVVNRTEWLEENINDYSFSSLLGQLDAHLANDPSKENIHTPDDGSSKLMMGSSSSTSASASVRNEMSDRCSIISESSIDFVNKFAELAEMIQDH